MRIDLRGLQLHERKNIIAWYLEQAPSMKMKGLFDAFTFLKSIEEMNPEFTKKAMVVLFEDFEEDDDDDEPMEIPTSTKKDVRLAYM